MTCRIRWITMLMFCTSILNQSVVTPAVDPFQFIPAGITFPTRTAGSTTELTLNGDLMTAVVTPTSPFLTLSCRQTKTCLKIVDQSYGPSCDEDENRECHDEACIPKADLRDVLSTLCNDKERCTVTAKKNSFPDTCQNSDSVLRIKYRCSSSEKVGKSCSGSRIEFSKRIKAGSKGLIGCADDSFTTVSVLSASYEHVGDAGVATRRPVLDGVLAQCPKQTSNTCFVQATASDLSEVLVITYECSAQVQKQVGAIKARIWPDHYAFSDRIMPFQKDVTVFHVLTRMNILRQWLVSLLPGLQSALVLFEFVYLGLNKVLNSAVPRTKRNPSVTFE